MSTRSLRQAGAHDLRAALPGIGGTVLKVLGIAAIAVAAVALKYLLFAYGHGVLRVFEFGSP
jgi:hypothetical protein